MDSEGVRNRGEIVAGFDGMTDPVGRPVRFAVGRQWSGGLRFVELAPQVPGIAEPAAVRAYAEGILDTLRAGTGEPDLVLFDDGCAQLSVTVGWDGGEPHVAVRASFDTRQDLIGVDRSGRPLHRDRFNAALLEMDDISPADPVHLTDPVDLTGHAHALLAALDRFPAEQAPD
ncbi:hypothetical protein [Peterkaempfera sp. SMS 1(5)a]|uniref:hypothetical protein n=1 Tax=Peterkaempfera podocarpi TaxID=3232308 RepID=UPI00366E497D